MNNKKKSKKKKIVMEFYYKKTYVVRLVQNPQNLILRFENSRVWERSFTDRDFADYEVLGGLEFIYNILKASLGEESLDIKECSKSLSFTLCCPVPHSKPIFIDMLINPIIRLSAGLELEDVVRQLRDLTTFVQTLQKTTTTLQAQLNEAVQRTAGYVIIAGSPNALSDKTVTINTNNLTSQNTIESLTNLRYFTECTSIQLNSLQIEDFSPLGLMPKLTSIVINSCPNLKTIDWIESLKNLHTVNFNSCQNLVNISPLSKLPNLKTIHINSTGVRNADFLGPAIQVYK